MSVCASLAIVAFLSLELPITQATVFSSSARVVRTGAVVVQGRARVALAVLPPDADAASIRLTVTGGGGEIDRVEFEPVGDADLPDTEAEELLRALEALDVELRRLRRVKRSHELVSAALRDLEPEIVPLEAPRPRPRLDPKGWDSVLAFTAARLEQAQGEALRIDGELAILNKKREGLAEKARRLGGTGGRGGHQVIATVTGRGKVDLALSYLVPQARWVPAYDINLDPRANQVRVQLAALVAQTTGEDWRDVQLTVSTATPLRPMPAPRLEAWRLGERERFVPTSRAMPRPNGDRQPETPRPASPTPVSTASERLRAQLLGRAEGAPKEEDDDGEEANDPVQMTRHAKGGVRNTTEAELKAAYDLDFIDHIPVERASAPRNVARPPAPAVQMEGFAVQATSARPRAMASLEVHSGGYGLEAEKPTSIALAPPRGHLPPPVPAGSAAALAGGHVLTWPAAARWTVETGKGERRVALFSRSFPVVLERKVVPALASEAFLVAEIKNPTGEPLPAGAARLAVAGDPAGEAHLPLVALGGSVTLPLGIDRALRPVRKVSLTQFETGFLSKSEVTRYVVTTEIANPHASAISLRIVDQIPLAPDGTVKVQLEEAAPAANHDASKGTLAWQLGLAPRAKATVKFVYTLTRAKGHELEQRP